MTDNRTTELRAKLTERGVKLFHSGPNVTYFETPYGEAQATEYEPGVFGVMMKDLTPEQAIAATLGSERHPYQMYVRGDGETWAEIMKDAFDDLVSTAAESCTPDEMREFMEHIAKLGSGTLTAEQVMAIARKHQPDYCSDTHVCFDWQAIADELNAELGVSE